VSVRVHLYCTLGNWMYAFWATGFGEKVGTGIAMAKVHTQQRGRRLRHCLPLNVTKPGHSRKRYHSGLLASCNTLLNKWFLDYKDKRF